MEDVDQSWPNNLQVPVLEKLFGPGRDETFHLNEIQNLRQVLFNAMVDNKPITIHGHRKSQCESDPSELFSNTRLTIKPTRIDNELIDALHRHPSLTIRCKLLDWGTLEEEDCILFLVKSNHEKCAREPNRKFVYYVVNINDPCLKFSHHDLKHIELMQANP